MGWWLDTYAIVGNVPDLRLSIQEYFAPRSCNAIVKLHGFGAARSVGRQLVSLPAWPPLLQGKAVAKAVAKAATEARQVTGYPIVTDLHALCLNSWPAAFSASLDLSSASDSLTVSSLQTLLQRFGNTLSPTCIAIHHMPNSYAKHPVSYVCYADPDGLPSFADECTFGNWSSDLYH